MRIAIIGSGISGLTAAHRLHPRHEVTVYEADRRIGGHANTVRASLDDGEFDVDTGFIVYNHRNYPVFTRLLVELGVETQPSDMSLAVRDERNDLEWGTNLSRLFSQRRNLASPAFVSMIGEVLRWNRLGQRVLAGKVDVDELTPVGDVLARRHFSQRFFDWYLIPLAAAIWSADPVTVDRFPIATFCRFLDNHGMLSLGERPEWRTVTGGSQRYVAALTAPFAERIRTSTPVTAVERHADGIDVRTAADPGGTTFDRVVLATHSDQALRLLSDADPAEKEVAGAVRYQHNVATLHTDRSMLPRNERTWASWNVQVLPGEQRRVAMTYHMNRLQSLESRHQICVTLNRHEDIDPATVIDRIDYEHPVFDAGAIAAQRRRDELQGRGGLFWAGAWWGYGFHEDGARSGAEVAHAIEAGA
ncbi:FAD-dependent oxidoreductase [Aquihabitans sp. G128]|uniref:NAD(P)/FAD-dependent oxidoreductase n=1 Tax=Aquihabitans sp. G128 TaxID=2849779 RepID=UPI001C23A6E1|nr:FAD-dependent oxidoreductase [Aquihabitans sp. G128]QXC62980.1 FAD-dependent oxidoreductase [Aquihabitans sp. G128]